MKKLTSFLILLNLLICLPSVSQTKFIPKTDQIIAKTIGQKEKILHMSANLVVDSAEKLFEYIDKAKAAGANTVLFSDTKLNTYGLNGTFSPRWDERMRTLREGVKKRGMKFHFISISMGFASGLIASNPNLTTGYPIRNQELRASNGELVPVKSANIVNGGFENFEGNKVSGWGFQDAVGQRTFIDTNIKRSGRASFRAKATGNQDSRIFTEFDVKPFHQYTLRFWIRTQNLTARNLAALIRDNNNKERTLTNLHISLPKDNGGRIYYNGANKLTTNGWKQVRIAFNSLNATRVNLALAVYGGKEGTIWWDDVQVLDTPSLNWLNRSDLPRNIKHANGKVLSFGTDVDLPVDKQLGISGFAGAFDTQHIGPKIRINSNANIKQGDIVKISGYHALPTVSGQVSASWNHPEIYRRMRTIHKRLYTDFKPDGFLLNYSEIRTGGWEPRDTRIGTSGAALAASIKRSFKDLFEVAPNAEYYFWSDMIDPNHNAISDYYQVNNTLNKSWVTLNPNKVTLATWWEGQKIIDKGTKSLKFFSDLGFKQVLGAFYDADVNTNYNQWKTASSGANNITGSIYATWVRPRNFSQIEKFGTLWWQGGNPSPAPGTGISGKFWRLENKVSKQWIRTKGCSVANSQKVPLVQTTINNTGNCTMFEFIPTNNGYYFIQNKATKGRYRPKNCSNISNDSVEIVQVGSSSFGWCEQWKLVKTNEKGFYRIQNRQTGGWIRVKGCSGTANDTTPITQVSQGYTGNCTKWKLIRVSDKEIKDNGITDATEVTLYPNPVNDQLSLRISENSSDKIQAITVYDMQGRKHGTIGLDKLSSNQNTIDVTSFANGLYILSVNFVNKQTQHMQFVVKH